jgi:hypothetical protein
MGKWTSHCSDCMPSENMRKRFDTTVAASPSDWTFEVITEDGHNGRVISPNNVGTWYICCYKEPIEGNTLLEFTMSYNDAERYMLRVKADTNSCPFEDDEHLRSATELERWRDDFLSNPPFDISSWVTVNRAGQQSISVVKKECQNTEEMTEILLESIDGVEQNNWV